MAALLKIKTVLQSEDFPEREALDEIAAALEEIGGDYSHNAS